MVHAGSIIGGLFVGLIVAFLVCLALWFTVLKCEECEECPEVKQIPLQYFLAKKCPTNFIKVADLRLPFKSEQNLSTNFEIVGKDALDKTWNLRKVNLCAGVLTPDVIATTIPDTRLYSFISKNNTSKINVDITSSTIEVADVRLLYQSSYTTLPFNPLTSTVYSTVTSNGIDYKYVEARIVPVELSDYVLLDKSTTTTLQPMLGIPMVGKSGDPIGLVVSSTFYDIGNYNYAVRFGVPERTIEGFYELAPYTKTPSCNNNVYIETVKIPEGVDYNIYNTTIQFTR